MLCFGRIARNIPRRKTSTLSIAMTTSVEVYKSHDYQLSRNDDADLMIISDVKETFTSALHSIALMTGMTTNDIAFVSSVAEKRLSVSAETTSSVELFVTGKTIPDRRVILALLPSKYGRHNTPSRSHSVASLVKSHKGSKRDLVVLLVPSCSDFCYPQALAVARQFPTYNVKTSKKVLNKEEVSNMKEEEEEEEEEEEVGNRVSIVLHADGVKESKEMLDHIIEGIRLTQDMVDSPPNKLNPDTYIERCIDVQSQIDFHNEKMNKSSQITMKVSQFYFLAK